jgi:hypothetical protein
MAADIPVPQPPDADAIARSESLAEVWDPAEPAIGAIFEQIPAAMGVPGVHLFWRLLGNFPGFLEAAWPALAVTLGSQALAEAAERLRHAAFIIEAVGLPSHKAFRGDLVRAEIDADFRAKIEQFNDASQNGLARLLVTAAAIRGSVRGNAFQASGPAVSTPRHEAPRNWVAVPPLRENEAAPKARELLDRIQREHHSRYLDDYFRSLGRIVEYLGATWNAIRPLVGDPEYIARASALSRMASDDALVLPTPTLLRPVFGELRADDATTLLALLDYFVDEHLPQALIDVTLIKALTSGPDRATVDRWEDEAGSGG